jgi:hypothetical protein
MSRLLVSLATLALGGCTLSAPAADATLAAVASGPGAPAAALDALARDALTAAAAAPEDVGCLETATRVLFQAADLRLQQATVAWLEANPGVDLVAVLAADDRLDDGVRTAVASLCQRGLELADQAAALAPDRVAVRLHQALHLSLLAWANGPTRSLFAGYGPKLVRAIDAAVALDPAHDGGAPLRLQGRFRGKAPWPYGDAAVARQASARAVATASLPVNLLFHGDVLAAAGELDAAVAQWRAAVTASADESTRWSAALLRELARRRLAAAGR